MANPTNQVDPEELKKKIEAIDEPEPETPKSAEPETNEAEVVDEPPSKAETPAETVEETATPAEEETDWKARYAGSTREAQVLAAKNRQITEAVSSAAQIEISDAEMRSLYNEWEMMDEVQKKMAKENALASKRFQLIQEKVEETKKVDEWVDKVKQFSTDPVTLSKYSALEGHETEFAQYAMVPSRLNQDMDDLARSFLYNLKPAEKKRKTLFQTGGGGPEAPKPKELSVTEIKFIRENQPKEYERLLKLKKIKIEI
jgi:type IV secretory pathway VirB10-like protein